MQLMSIEDLAVYLGDSKRTIYKYIAGGDCPPYMKISSKNIKFDRADVDAWLESKKVARESEKTCSNPKALPWMPLAKEAMKLAEKEAKQQKLNYVGTEHLLLGIMTVEDCLGAIVLKNLEMNSKKFQELYKHFCNNTQAPDSGDMDDEPQLMNTAQMAVRCAIGEAIRYGHTYIGTEHLLPGILLVSGGLGYKILTQLGIILDDVRSETAKLLICRPVSKNVNP